jgi:hypothetical protein
MFDSVKIPGVRQMVKAMLNEFCKKNRCNMYQKKINLLTSTEKGDESSGNIAEKRGRVSIDPKWNVNLSNVVL